MSVFRGKSTGSVEAMGRSLDEIVEHASEQIKTYLGERDFKITAIAAHPVYYTGSDEPITWGCEVDFEEK